ncbi:MAG: peptidase M50 [Rubrivivax sp.]|nr:peptidase M50 [Rubrivivax sp.]
MQALLSEHWHAVRYLRPRLREGVQPLHRVLRGQAWVLLQDPVTQRFHRVTPPVWRVLALLDGQRTLDQVWEAACAAAGEDEAISQHDLVQLMGALYGQDLLQTQVSPDAGEVLARYRKQQRSQLKQRWLNPMSLRLPLLFPDRWFDGQLGIARALFSRTAALLWLLFVAPAAVLAWQHWGALTENLSDRVLSAQNLLLLWFTYPVVKSVHEWAHGLAVKAGGGTVREIGLMFIVFTPVPYVDATASYRFPSKWARAGVAAAGILAELAIGAAAVYVWLAAEPGLVTALAFNVILIAGVSTLLVNGNPLMRYDGYFVLSDLLELPNLAQRATSCWAWVIDRWAFGAHDAQPPIGLPAGPAGRRERLILLVYGLIAPIYRLLITIGLIWFVAQEYLLIGAIMALWASWTAFVMPLWKGWKHLRESPGLARKRSPALRRTVGALVVLALLIGVLPLPFHSVHPAVVWLPDEAIVRAEASGTVASSLPAPGSAVTPGQPLLQLEDPRQTAELAVAAAAVAQAEAQLRQAEVAEPARAGPLRTELAVRQARLGESQRRHAALQVVAGAAGRWVPAAATELPGRFVKRGEVLGFVVGGASARVRTAIVQEDGDLIRSRLSDAPGHVQVRLGHDIATVRPATLRRQVPGGEFNLVSPALGTSGGGNITVDPAQAGGTRSLQRVFDLELQLDQPTPLAVFGDRAWVRFDLGPAPLAWQWYIRLRQVFLAQLSV